LTCALTELEACSLVRASVVLLNFNGSRFLPRLINTLAQQAFQDFEVVFVDNGSTDGSLQLLRRLLRKVPNGRLRMKVVRTDVNLGYCGGNNLGLKSTEGEFVIFLSNDTFVDEKWLKELVRVMSSNKAIGACQSRLLYPATGEVQTDGWLYDKYGWVKGLVLHKRSSGFSTAPFYASGASIAIRNSTLKTTGGFDSELFYGDYDLCWRIRLLGHSIAVALDSICYHYWGGTVKRIVPPGKALFDRDREILRVFTKCYSTRNLVKRLPGSVVIMLVEAVKWTWKYRNPEHLASWMRAVTWYLRKLRSTMRERSRVQSTRRIPDEEIVKKMLPFSLILTRKARLRQLYSQ
jgi:GT2 family glycosyltransferase